MLRFASLLLLLNIATQTLATVVGLESEVYATSEFGITHRLYVSFDSPTDELIAIYGTVGANGNSPLSILSSAPIFNSTLGTNFGDGINPLFFSAFPEVEFDSWLTIGSADNSGSGGINSVGMETYLSQFNAGDGFTVDTFTGASWFVIPGTSADALAGDDNRVLIAQITTNGVVDAVINVQSDDAGGTTTNTTGLTLSFPQVETGCTDDTACNFNPLAELDDDSCAYPGAACDDGNSNTTNDVYSSDCSCSGDVIVEGCMDSSACNYNDQANQSDDSCYSAGDACDDGNASTGGDVYNFNCVCEGFDIVFGCMDVTACNFDSAAEASDDSCIFPGDACDDGLNNTIDDAYQSDCTCSGELVPTGPAGLSYEVHSTSEYGTTYRVYATFDAPTNELIAVYGTQAAPMSFETTTAFFNSTLGSNFGEGINPLFFGAFPEVEFDSWLTIGSYDNTGSGGVNSVGLESYLALFNQGEGFTIDTFLGGSWFVIPGASEDAISGDDDRVLVAQLTTDGVTTLTMNFQYDDLEGNSNNTEGLTITFPEVPSGCTDEGACNYDSEAEVNDGSCAYPGDSCDDGDAGTMNDTYSALCSCDGETIIVGCTNQGACNYNAEANSDDGSCANFDECGVCGGDGIAEGACDCEGNGPETYYNCEGECLNDTDDDGVCDELEVAGCLDSEACNYNADATDDSADCTYADDLYDCDGNCQNDLNNNNLCDELETFGCTSMTADNYDPEALTDNGTCEWLGGLVQSLSYEVYTEGGVEGTTTYRLYANFNSDDIEVVAAYGTDASPWQLTPSTSFYQDALGTPLASGINPAFFTVFPSLEFDTWLALGAAPGQSDGTNTAGMETFYPPFEAGGALNVNTFLGGSIFVIPGQTAQTIPVDGKVLLAQVTTDGFTEVLYNLQIRDSNDESVEIVGMELSFPQVEITGTGCTDVEALNYDSGALLDDGTCEYPEPSYTGLSFDQVASNEPTAGMRTFRVYANFSNPNDQLTAVFAQEGNPMAISTTASFYQNDLGGAFASEINPFAAEVDPDAAYDSWFTIGGENSNVNVSTIGVDEAASEFEAGGAFEVTNNLGGSWFVLPDLEPLAFPDVDGRVLIAQLTTSGQVSFDVNLQYRAQDGTNPQILGETLIFPDLNFGCTNEEACNYDEDAEEDAGNCILPELYYDCAGACVSDADGDGICDELEVPGCTNSEADNYNSAATDDDGSCEFLGCTNSAACNYDPSANVNDNSCSFPALFYNCGGECNNDSDGDGVCDELEILGCTDMSASNYNVNATDDDGSCEFPGCTNPEAENFDPSANLDDGSCIAPGCTYANAANYDALASEDDGSCSFEGCTDSAASNFCALAVVNDGSCSYDVLGCTYLEADNYSPSATVDDGSCELPQGEAECPFDTDGNGLVGSADLLEFLAAYSYPCP
jgi:hypothetical protein